jgi:hypothetical protein
MRDGDGALFERRAAALRRSAEAIRRSAVIAQMVALTYEQIAAGAGPAEQMAERRDRQARARAWADAERQAGQRMWACAAALESRAG